MPIIEAEHLTKEYKLGRLTSFKDTTLNVLRRCLGKVKIDREVFAAIDDISFTIKDGEVVGIIGTNGAGKSTLLKLLASITRPTRGELAVRGSVAPLIEVGAGLNPELTGRENIFLNGAILGIPKAIIKQKLDAIIEFAELEQFIDTPIKRYSSGMSVRLGFSIATTLDADILIVDEVLSVGDLAFQRKCFDRMEQLIKRQGKTVLIVSHNIRQIERICTRAILFDRGKILKDGAPEDVCKLFYDRSNQKILSQHGSSQAENEKFIESSGELNLAALSIHQGDITEPVDNVEMHQPMEIAVGFECHAELSELEIVIGFHTTDFVYVASSSSLASSANPTFQPGTHSFICELKDTALTPGVYGLRLAVLDKNRRLLWYGENLLSFQVKCTTSLAHTLPRLGLVDLPFSWKFEQSARIKPPFAESLLYSNASDSQ